MSKPKTLRDLLVGGHISAGEVRLIADSIFDGKTTGAGPEGYVITACKFGDLSEHVQKFVTKAILSFTVENVFDQKSSVKEDAGDDLDTVEHEGEAVAEDDAKPRRSRRTTRRGKDSF